MPDTRIRNPKATTLLREDHRKVKKLFAEFDKLEETDMEEMTSIFRQVKQELTVHAQIEEEIFYPACQRAEDDDADELVREAHEEHRIVKQLLDELGAMSVEDPQFCAKMKVLKDTVLHHAEEEEDEVFPLFEDLDRAQQHRISGELMARKQALAPEEED